eukprot:2174353-Rhodomonas_salina.1
MPFATTPVSEDDLVGTSKGWPNVVERPFDTFVVLHRFRVEIKRRETGSFLARDGQIKIGFFECDLDPHENWMETGKDHK